MAEPITWRTVAGNSLENAWRPMQGAVETFNGGLDRLSKVLEDRQAVNQGVADRGREANVQAYLDAVQGASTPEALQTLHDSGHLDQLRANIDPRDLARVRGADEARLSTVHKNITDNRAFDDANTQFVNRDAINAALARAVQDKDPTAAIGMLPENLPNRADLVKQMVLAAQGNTKFGSEMDKDKAQIKRWGDETRIGDAQVGVSQQEANTHKRQVDLLGQEALEKRLSDTSQKLVGLQTGLNSPAAQGEIDAFIKTLSNQGDQERVQRAIGRLASNPKYSGMSAEAAIQAARADLSTAGDFRKNWLWNGTGDNIESHADAIVNSDGYKEAQRYRSDSVRTLQQQRDILRASLYPGSVPGMPAVTSPAAGTAAGDGGMTNADAVALARRYNGDSAKTVAAADLGPDVVDAAIAKYGNTWLSHLPQDTQDYVAEETKGKPATIKGFDTPVAASSNPQADIAAVTKKIWGPETAAPAPTPTQRFNNPPNSVAGKAEARAFAVQQSEAAQRAQLQQIQRDEIGKAQTQASDLLSSGNAKALAKFQTTPAFGLLDRDTKAKIFQIVNGR